MKNNKPILYLALMAMLLQGCPRGTSNDQTAGKPVLIAISKAVPQEAYQNYVRWIKFADSSASYVDMYHLSYDSALALLEQCDGLLLTGGTDIYPGRYGKEGDTARCWAPDFKRDTMEARLFRAAREMGMPIMGICRGLQLINVESGGTLYIDLPTDLDTLVTHRLEDSYDARHNITIFPGSMLSQVAGVSSGSVNSAHHQGIERLGSGLVAQAETEDGLTESIGLADTTAYLLGVQWHPERMDYSQPLSARLGTRFLKEARKYQKNKTHE